VYVHVPFCTVRCPYCDFATRPYRAEEAPRLVTCVAHEVRLRALAPGTPQAWGSLYFGGGTPSRLEPDAFRALVKGIDAALAFVPGHERSLEANPEDLDGARLQAFRDSGVERLSIGAQSLFDDELAQLGRVHDARAVETGVARARTFGFKSLSVDLMYAYPGHTLERFAGTLERALALGPDHVSAYAYTAESGTPMGDAVQKGTTGRPDEDAEALFFETARDMLEAAGFRHYEISNFARPGHETLHHVNYWRRGEYLGLGPSAVSFVGERRARAPRGLVAWAERIEALAGGESQATPFPARWDVEDAAPFAAFETVFLGLRLDGGVRTRDWPAAVDVPERERWRAAATPLVERGWLRATAGGWRVARAERLRTDAIALAWREGVDRLAPLRAS